jgi:hypothetical protein
MDGQSSPYPSTPPLCSVALSRGVASASITFLSPLFWFPKPHTSPAHTPRRPQPLLLAIAVSAVLSFLSLPSFPHFPTTHTSPARPPPRPPGAHSTRSPAAAAGKPPARSSSSRSTADRRIHRRRERAPPATDSRRPRTQANVVDSGIEGSSDVTACSRLSESAGGLEHSAGCPEGPPCGVSREYQFTEGGLKTSACVASAPTVCGVRATQATDSRHTH